MNVQELKQKRNEIEDILHEAASKLLSYDRSVQSEGNEDSLQIDQKADQSLVTEADYASNEIILGGLKNVFRSIPIRSEEDLGAEDLNEHYWLVDPLDGTKQFVDGKNDYAILLAYVGENGIPIAGWMVFPALNIFIGAIGDELNIFSDVTLVNPLCLASGDTLRSQSIYCRNTKLRENFEGTTSLFPEREVHSGTAFLKFFTGELDGLVLTFQRLGSWDVAAAVAIIHALGGVVFNEQQQAFCCSPLSELFIATTKQKSSALLELLG